MPSGRTQLHVHTLAPEAPSNLPGSDGVGSLGVPLGLLVESFHSCAQTVRGEKQLFPITLWTSYKKKAVGLGQ